jgi:hypothetical protein
VLTPFFCQLVAVDQTDDFLVEYISNQKRKPCQLRIKTHLLPIIDEIMITFIHALAIANEGDIAWGMDDYSEDSNKQAGGDAGGDAGGEADAGNDNGNNTENGDGGNGGSASS